MTSQGAGCCVAMVTANRPGRSLSDRIYATTSECDQRGLNFIKFYLRYNVLCLFLLYLDIVLSLSLFPFSLYYECCTMDRRFHACCMTKSATNVQTDRKIRNGKRKFNVGTTRKSMAEKRVTERMPRSERDKCQATILQKNSR